MIVLSLFIMLLAAEGQTPKPLKQVYKITVDGSLFKVRVRGDVVTVKRQTLAYNANLHHRDMMREAAERATCCALKDEMLNIAAELEARLDCNQK